MKNTFPGPGQGQFWNQVFLQYLDHQALVLTHEGASQVEQLPYLSVMLAPIPVLDFYGRCATRDPPCHKNHAVFYWWQDSQNFCSDIFPENFRAPLLDPWIHLALRMSASPT